MTTFPFPFLGAGYIVFDGACSLYVRFQQKPPIDLEEKLFDSIPPLLVTAETCFRGELLLVKSEYNIQRDLQVYLAEKEHDFDCWQWLSKTIEDWLLGMHVLWPIHVVVIPEEEEMRLTEWHYDSIARIPDLIEEMRAIPLHRRTGPEFGDMIEHVLSYDELLSEEKHLAILEELTAKWKLRGVIKAGVAENVKRLFENTEWLNSNSEDACDVVAEELNNNNLFEGAVFALEALVRHQRRYFLYKNSASNHLVLEVFRRTGKDNLITDVQQWIIQQNNLLRSDVFHGLYLGAHRYYQPRKNWDMVIFLYDFLIEIVERTGHRHFDLSFYCNCLWPLQYDNTARTIDVYRNERYISISLPFGPKNPAIFFNIACLYAEMKNVKMTKEMVTAAFEHGIDMEEKSLLIRELKSSAVFKLIRSGDFLERTLLKYGS